MKCCFKSCVKHRIGSDGSSLAIALFFFMLCSLMCAGFIYLANSSTRTSAQLNSIQPYVAPPLPTPSVTPEPTPEIDPNYADACEAVNFMFDYLCSDYDAAFAIVESGGTYQIIKKANPENLSYEILSYYNFKFGTNDVPIQNDNGIEYVERTYKVTVANKPAVQVTFMLYDTYGSQGNMGTKPSDKNFKGCLQFKSLTITVKSDVSGCDYVRTKTYSLNGELCYIKCLNSNNTAVYPKNFYFEISGEQIWW